MLPICVGAHVERIHAGGHEAGGEVEGVVEGLVRITVVLHRVEPAPERELRTHPVSHGADRVEEEPVAARSIRRSANVAAPPLIVYYLALGLAPATMVQAMQICFLVGKSTQFVVLSTQGGIGVSQWLETIPFCAIAVASGFVGARVRGSIDAKLFRRIVKGSLGLIAFALFAQYLYRALPA